MIRSKLGPLGAFAVTLAVHLAGTPCLAQSRPAAPWSVDFTHDRATATNYGFESIWTTDRAQLGWTRPERGGWFLSGERQKRGALVDVALATHGYRRMGDWTVAAGVGAAPAADFLSRATLDLAVSRRIVGTLVASGGYRYLHFRQVNIHQPQPALTWYHPRGEIEARLYLTHNSNTGRTSPTLRFRTSYSVHSRVDLSGGFAYGDRIFDIASLPTGTSHSHATFGRVRLGLTSRDSLSLGGVAAHEDPAFAYRALSIGYERTF